MGVSLVTENITVGDTPLYLQIQRNWRGYYVRRFVFDYRAYKAYLCGVVAVNERVRAYIRQEEEKREQERQAREDHMHEVPAQEQARRHHYLLGTSTVWACSESV